jgi:hypothetical protein
MIGKTQPPRAEEKASQHNLIKGLLVAFVVFATLLLLLEVGYRAYWGNFSFDPLLFRPEPNYIADTVPNIEKSRTVYQYRPPREILYQTNRFGFRDDRDEYGDQDKILVLGDSNILALFVSHENTFPERLEDYLNNEFHSLNLGVAGFGPDQSYLKLAKHLDQFKPRVVVFQVFADNDYGDLIRNVLFRIEDGRGLVNVPFEGTDPAFNVLASLGQYSLIAKDLYRNLQIQGRIGVPKPPRPNWLKLDEFLDYEELALRRYQNNERSTWGYDHYDYSFALDPNAPIVATQAQLMESVISAARDLTEAAGARFVLVIQPSSVDMTRNRRLNYANLNKCCSGYNRRRLSRSLVDIAKKNDISYVDLWPTFLVNRPEELYFKVNKDDHWTAKGMDLAARETALKIREVIEDSKTKSNLQ